MDNCFDEKITVVCDNTASHDLDHHMASMSMHKNKTRGPSSINGLYVNKIGDHVGDSPQLNNDEESSISVDGLHAISNGVQVWMASKPSTNKQASEKLLIMMGLTDWIIFMTAQRRKFATMRRPENFKNYGPPGRVSFDPGGFGLKAKLENEFFRRRRIVVTYKGQEMNVLAEEISSKIMKDVLITVCLVQRFTSSRYQGHWYYCYLLDYLTSMSNEPTSSAIGYRLDHNSDIFGKINVHVFDPSGGTFDVSQLTNDILLI
ncbi:hypothetical protein L1987_70759 [Smallanthus sonchifolius]|uniref:Uncharacterized protein n=1 Tax=Smallanthus sonchifolius TaxID=185202 RepID=A0ACB9AR71_9ASTR|nr:hypothetical protein L1987_70759 [Smallanthus sonchifolius]